MNAAAAVPVAVEFWRGPRIESRHRASAVACDRRGKLALAIGDVEAPVYPRSAIKPLQAIPLVVTGALDAFARDEADLALACASHGGEPMHTRRVADWLGVLGLGADALACGAHAPTHKPTAELLARAGEWPTRLHNNCSGKHAGMLSVARRLDVNPAGYARPDHPVQQQVAGAISNLTGVGDLGEPSIDGCGLPNWAIPLAALARGFAQLADPRDLQDDLALAARRITTAMRRHPELVAGTGRCCTTIMRALPAVVVKTGAEGVYAGALLDHGLGLALKVEDGAGRAAEPLIIALLRHFDAAGGGDASLTPFASPVLRNYAGEVVGAVRLDPHWLG